MNDKFFVDSNIGIYLFDNDLKKAEIARSLFTADAVISTQAIDAVRFIRNKVTVKPITPELFDIAFSVLIHYNFSFYDSVIVASALDAGCSKLFSEDLHHTQLIENKLTIVNPFV